MCSAVARTSEAALVSALAERGAAHHTSVERFVDDTPRHPGRAIDLLPRRLQSTTTTSGSHVKIFYIDLYLRFCILDVVLMYFSG